MKLLLIEDNAETREMLTASLEGRWDVVTAEDGSEALKHIAESLKSKAFDALVVDVAMLYVDGTQFVKVIRCFEEHEIYPCTRILLHTAHRDLVENGEVLERLNLKRKDLYLKPMDTPKLIKALTQP